MSFKGFAVIITALIIATLTASASEVKYENERLICEFESPQSAQLLLNAKDAAITSTLNAAKLLRSIVYRYGGTEANRGTPEADGCLVAKATQELNDLRKTYVAHEYPEITPKELDASGNKGGLARILLDKGERAKIVPAALAESRFLSAPASVFLWVLYRSEVPGVKLFDPQIYSFYKEMAEEGSPRAKYYLGMIYSRGYGQAKDQALAKKWFTASGTSDALMELGAMLFENNDESGAEKAWLQAVGDESSAAYELGVLYRDQKKYDLALQYFNKRLEKQPDDVETLVNIGQMNLEGWGVPANCENGKKYYDRAAYDLKNADVLAILKKYKKIAHLDKLKCFK